MNAQAFSWDAAATTKLKDLFGAGLSFSLIAARLGTTRTAARKKANRMGLHRGRPTATKPMGPKPIPKPKEPEAIGPIEGISDGCKYIAGDPKQPGWRMCGQDRIASKPFCAFHADRCYEAARSAP